MYPTVPSRAFPSQDAAPALNIRKPLESNPKRHKHLAFCLHGVRLTGCSTGNDNVQRGLGRRRGGFPLSATLAKDGARTAVGVMEQI
jgi:hypothetical protein